MIRYLLTSFALAAELIAAYPALAEAPPAPAAASADMCGALPAAATVRAPAHAPVGVVGEGWG